MNSSNDELIKFLENPLVWLYILLVKKYPKRSGIIFVVIILLGIVWWIVGDNLKYINISSDKPKQTSEQNQVLGKDYIEEKINDEYVKNNQCNNYPISIVGTKYIQPVGSQRFYAEDGGYSARNTKDFQASSETSWGCGLPFTAQIVSIPISGPSFGLSFEYFNMFKVLIGDGDRKTIRVEQNKYGIRGSWPEIVSDGGKKRPTLINPIEDNEEVTLTINAKYLNGKVVLKIEVLHSKFKSKEEFIYQFEPTAVNFQSGQPRKFRVGINDSNLKGNGSVIDLQTLSIKEGEW